MAGKKKADEKRQEHKIEIMVTDGLRAELRAYAVRELRRNLSSVTKELWTIELRTKSLANPKNQYVLPLEDAIERGFEEGETPQPDASPEHPAAYSNMDMPDYGRMAIFENEDKTLRYGVAVYPYRSSACLITIDLTVEKGFPGRLDLARGIAPDLDLAFSLGPYSWDTRSYRELCERLGLNPDHRRPKYRDAYKDLADRLVAEIDKDTNSDFDTLSRKNFWYDFLDLIRTDVRPTTELFERVKRDVLDYQEVEFGVEISEVISELSDEKFAQAPQTGVVVHFLPSAFGTGFNASLISRNGEGCQADGWHQKLYSGLGGVALDFETDTQWLETVHQRLLEQGVIFVSRPVAEYYMNNEGAYWVWSNGGFSMFREIEAREITRKEAFIWRFRKPETPISDAAVVNFNVARMRRPPND